MFARPQAKLYHLGIRGHIAKSTLADANEARDWSIYADLAMSLIQTARALYANDSFAVELEQTTYALDTTTIDLCLSVFPWAHFRSAKAAVKMHTLLDLLIPEAGSVYLMDRGFLDFARLYCVQQAAAFFVIRAKRNTVCRRVYSRAVDTSTGLRCDQTIALTGQLTQHDYPIHLRRIKFYDAEHDRQIVFLTNTTSCLR